MVQSLFDVNVGDVHANNYENLPIQYTETFFQKEKLVISLKKNIFLTFLLKTLIVGTR